MLWNRFVAVIGAFIAVGAISQQPLEEASPPKCAYSELYRKEGWVIPGLDGAKKKAGRIAIPDKLGVYVTQLEPTEVMSTIQVFRCSREHADRLEIEDITVGIEHLSAFDFGGRTFAYSLTYGVDGIGASWYIMFYDLNGSGRFALRRSERSRFVPELIPDWVKNSRKD